MADNAALYKSAEGYALAMKTYDKALGQLSVPYEIKQVNTRFGETQVIAAGPESGVPIVMLHGWDNNATDWVAQINALGQTYRVYAPDTIGQTGKSAPTRPSTKDASYGEWLLDVVDALKLEQAHFVGVSGGAWLLLKFATVAAARIKKAVLISPAGFTSISLPTIAKMSVSLLFAGRKSTEQILQTLSAPHWQPPEIVVEEISILLKHFKSQAVPPPLTDEELRQLTAPTLLLMGQYEALFKPSVVVARARQVLPDLITAQIIPDAGHILPYEQPDLLNLTLQEFFKEI